MGSNDSIEGANVLNISTVANTNNSILGTIDFKGDVDNYKVNLKKGYKLATNLTSPSGKQYQVGMYGSSGSLISTKRYIYSDGSYNLNYIVPIDGIYYISVQTYTKDYDLDQKYSLKIYYTNLQDNTEINDGTDSSTQINSGTEHTNKNIDNPLDDDVYKISVPSAGKLTIMIKMSNGERIGSIISFVSGLSSSRSINNNTYLRKTISMIPSGGQYYIVVRDENRLWSISKKYSIAVYFTPTQSFDEFEKVYDWCTNDYVTVNGGIVNSHNLGDAAGNHQIIMDNPDDFDWFKLRTSTSKTVKIDLTGIPSGDDYDFIVENSSGEVIASSCNSSNAKETATIYCQANQNYFVGVCADSWSASTHTANLSCVDWYLYYNIVKGLGLDTTYIWSYNDILTRKPSLGSASTGLDVKLLQDIYRKFGFQISDSEYGYYQTDTTAATKAIMCYYGLAWVDASSNVDPNIWSYINRLMGSYAEMNEYNKNAARDRFYILQGEKKKETAYDGKLEALIKADLFDLLERRNSTKIMSFAKFTPSLGALNVNEGGLFITAGSTFPVAITAYNCSYLKLGFRKIKDAFGNQMPNLYATMVADPKTAWSTNQYTNSANYNLYFSHVFKDAGTYEICVRGSNTPYGPEIVASGVVTVTAQGIPDDYKAVEEAYSMLEVLRSYQKTLVYYGDVPDPEINSDLFKIRQNAFYIMYTMLECNSVVRQNSYVCKYIATRLLDGQTFCFDDIKNIKASLMTSNITANKYFSQWEQQLEDERLSKALSLIPFIGGIKGFIDGVEGKDVLTGRKLAWWERTLGITCGALDVVAIGSLTSVAIKEVRAVSLVTRLEVTAGRISEAVAETISNITRVMRGTNVVELVNYAKKIKVYDDYVEFVTKEGNLFKMAKSEVPDGFAKLDIFIYGGKFIDEAAEASYSSIRVLGLSDVSTVAKNTGLTTEQITNLKNHLFLEKHLISQKGGVLMKLEYFTADDEIAYVWKCAQKGELSMVQKEWFQKLANHELTERSYMQQGMEYRRLESWDSVNKTFKYDPVNNAHDKAPIQPEYATFPGFTP